MCIYRRSPSGSSTVRISENTEKSSFFIWNATYMSSGSTATKSASRLFTFSKHSIRSLAATHRIEAYCDVVLSTSWVQALNIKSGTHILSNRAMPLINLSGGNQHSMKLELLTFWFLIGMAHAKQSNQRYCDVEHF